MLSSTSTSRIMLLFMAVLLLWWSLSSQATSHHEEDWGRKEGDWGMSITTSLLPSMEQGWDLTMEQLHDLFKQGSLDKGIPIGFGKGYTRMSLRIQQPIADAIWDGKTIEVTNAHTNCPNADCGCRGIMYNVVGRREREIIPASVYVGHLSDANPNWARYELDDKLSVIIDYFDQVTDEIRLVNADKDIYLGRFLVGGMLAGYFIIQFQPWEQEDPPAATVLVDDKHHHDK